MQKKSEVNQVPIDEWQILTTSNNIKLEVLPLNSILHIKSILMANDIADTPKKNPDGELSSEALAPAVT